MNNTTAQVPATRTNRTGGGGIMPVLSGLLALLLSFMIAAPAYAQCPGVWVPGIGSSATNGNILASAILPGGDIIAGGSFTIAGA